jgi:hypothetical protein
MSSARIANNSPDPLRFLTDLGDEIKAVVKGANIADMNRGSRQPHRAIQRRSTAFANEAAARRSRGCRSCPMQVTPDLAVFPGPV